MDIECIYSGTERKYISEFLSLANIAGFLFSPFFYCMITVSYLKCLSYLK